MKLIKSLTALVFLCGMTLTLGCGEPSTPATDGAGSGTGSADHEADLPDHSAEDHQDEDGGDAPAADGGEADGGEPAGDEGSEG